MPRSRLDQDIRMDVDDYPYHDRRHNGSAPRLITSNRGGERLDRVTRASALSLITEIMLNETLAPMEAVNLLQDLSEGCRQSGVALPELLAEEMYVGGVTPLGYEILRCERTSLELATFLIAETTSPKVPLIVRNACFIRNDNELFQELRSVLSSSGRMDVSVTESVEGEPLAFNVFWEVRHLADLLKKLDVAPTEKPKFPKEKVRIEDPPVPVEIDWIAQGRAWSLILTQRDATLRLLDGPPTSIKADVMMLEGEGTSRLGTLQMEFPTTKLHAISIPGIHQVKSTPTMSLLEWAGSQLTTFVHIGVQLDVQISNSADRIGESLGSELPEEEDWVLDDATPSEQDKDWVLASWSGQDKELDK